MPYNVLVTEKLNKSPDEVVYVKASELNGIVRVDSSLKPPSSIFHKIREVLYDIFLPRDFPSSVSKDYVNYQIWDTIQASCSTISNTLVTKTVLEGLGVGDNTATSAGAAVTWILKDGAGRFSGIFFAWLSSSGLDAQCKKWRLFADILNDLATLLELTLLPLFPKMALRILCLSTSMKAIVGVAGGATRAAITQHQAIKQNMADVSAKDGSQETCVNLIASLLSAVLIVTVVNNNILWFLFISMTFLHLYANYKAVKSLNFNVFNRERLFLVIQEYLLKEIVLSPTEINRRESVYLGFGLSDLKLCGYKIRCGYSFEKLMKDISPFELHFLVHMFKNRRYILFIVRKQNTIYILLHEDHTTLDILEGYFQAVLHGLGSSFSRSKNVECLKAVHLNEHSLISKLRNELISSKNNPNPSAELAGSEAMMIIDQFTLRNTNNFLRSLINSGWDFEKHLLEVRGWRANWGDRVLESHSQLVKKDV